MGRYLFVAIIAFLCPVSRAFAWPTNFSTGTTLYEPTAYPGYILFAPLSIPVGMQAPPAQEGGTAYLINMRGEEVHRWKMPFYPLQVRLLKNGNLAVMGQINKNASNRPGFGKLWMGGASGKLAELTWDGKTVFTCEDLNMHHDFARLPNGHYMYLAWERIPVSLQAKIRGGIKGSEFPNRTMFNDVITEVDSKAKIVWKWHANEHLNPDTDIIGPIYKREEWLHANSLTVLSNGNVALSSRATDSILLIDKKTGRIAFRWGNSSYLDKASGHVEQQINETTLGGPHDVDAIPSGLPGAGHLLCYDNGIYKCLSRVVEIDLNTRKLVWQSGKPGIGRVHFSDIMGGAQRLPNGNTLICEGINGRFFQVTPSNETVWEYVSPYVPNPNLHGSVFNIHQYRLDYCPQFKNLKATAASPTSSPTIAPDQPADESTGLAPTLAPAAVLLLLLGFAAWKRRHQGA